MPKHKSRLIQLFMVDVLISLDRIKRFTANFKSFESFDQCGECVFGATMRELEILGEAVKNIVQSEKFVDIVNPEWRIIVDFRNVLTHAYFGIELEEVFNVIRNDLPVFEKEFLEFLEGLKSKGLFLKVLDGVLGGLSGCRQVESIPYLESVQKLLSS